MKRGERIAIIGTGIAGMSCAYFINERFGRDVKLSIYEKNSYVGGHTNTISVSEGNKNVAMDTGFMVFNEETYPLLTRLFKKLKVPYKNTDMSFAVRFDPLNIEYNGSGILGLFSQRKNIFNWRHISMLLEINRFNKTAPKHLEDSKYSSMSIGDYTTSLGYSNDFIQQFLVPMSSAVWSTPYEKMLDFPALTLIRFFYNHGFMGLNTQHQWKTVVGGSIEYRKKLTENFQDKIKVNCSVMKVSKDNNKFVVTDRSGANEFYDRVIFACHGDESCSLLDPRYFHQAITVLKNFRYQKNIATVHTDSANMPKLKRSWASWNYITPVSDDPYVVYYMNRLQGVSDKVDYFININGQKYVDSKKVLRVIEYHHPLFDQNTVSAQAQLRHFFSAESGVHFIGSYYRYGFHEDALLSAYDLCQNLFGLTNEKQELI